MQQAGRVEILMVLSTHHQMYFLIDSIGAQHHKINNFYFQNKDTSTGIEIMAKFDQNNSPIEKMLSQ
jgi:hypothetical protein